MQAWAQALLARRYLVITTDNRREDEQSTKGDAQGEGGAELCELVLD